MTKYKAGDRVNMTKSARDSRSLKGQIFGTIQRVEKDGRLVICRDGQKLNRSYNSAEWRRVNKVHTVSA
jgi:hypothetical protein